MASPYTPPESELDIAGMGPKATNRRWVIFSLACGTSFMLYLHRFTWNVVGAILTDKEQMGDNVFTEETVAWVGGMFNITYSIGQVPGGIMSDFFGPHIYLASSIVLWSISLALIGLSVAVGWLVFSRLAFGLAQSGCYPALSRVSHTWFEQDKRTTLQGLVATLCGRGGGAVAPLLLASFLIGYCELSWELSLAVMALLGIGFAVIFFLYFRNDPSSDPLCNETEVTLLQKGKNPKAKETGNVLPFKKAFTHVGMLFFMLQQFFNAGIDNFFGLLTGVYFVQVLDVDLSSAAWMISMPLLGGAFGGVVGGILNDYLVKQVGRKWARRIVGSSGKAIACGLVFVALSFEDPAEISIGLFFVKFFSDWTQPTVWGTSTDLGREYTGSVFSIINCSGSVGGVVFPIIFAFILATTKDAGMFSEHNSEFADFTPIFVFVACCYLVCSLCWFMIDCTKPIVADDDPINDEPTIATT